MARLVYDGNTSIIWVAGGVANMAAPTTSELSGGVDLTTFVPKDGVDANITQGKVDGGDLSTRYEGSSPGTWTDDMKIMFFKDDSADTAWDTFDLDTEGDLVWVWDGRPVAAGSKAYVFRTVTGKPLPESTKKDERQKFSVQFFGQAEPEFDAVVA